MKTKITFLALSFACFIIYSCKDGDEKPSNLVSSEQGGTIKLPSKAQVTLQANSVVDANGNPYNGDVLVDLKEISLNQTTELGLKFKGNPNILLDISSILEVNLRDSKNNPLNITDSSPATLRFPLEGTLPQVLSLFSYDESEEYWVLEGQANLSADKSYYEAEVTHFSYWAISTTIVPVENSSSVYNTVRLKKTFLNGNVDAEYTYDASGRISNINTYSFGNGSIHHDYNAAGLLAVKTITSAGNANKLYYKYQNGILQTVKDSAFTVVKYSMDYQYTNGKISQISTVYTSPPSTYVAKYIYGTQGEVIQTKDGADAVTGIFTYFNFHGPTPSAADPQSPISSNSLLKKKGEQTINNVLVTTDYSYEFDDNGRLFKATITSSSQPGISYVYTYEYEAI